MRSIRRWSYEAFKNEKLIRFVVMVTPEDLKANAEYIRMADQYVNVPGGANNNNYANVELIVDLAKRSQVQAVWAGWGHASENPHLPQLLHKHGLVFIGPPAHAMWSLGDKIASSIVAQTANVPTLPWSGSGLKVDWDHSSNKNIVVPDDVYKQGCISTVEEAINSAASIGYPVMIKASEGGGGKGIRKVSKPDDVRAAFRQVQLEVPGSPIFIMKMAKKARHLEVQLMGDKYGNAISLFGRDCSIQRRHQKIIEEAPAEVADEDVFEQMERCAVRLAKMVGYVSAGTVEYLYDPEKNEFFFLELNPRLQVEHPCTEMVADVNLPAIQLQVAMGIPLHRIKDIRVLYGADLWADNAIDFDDPVFKPQAKGHVIAARITSENPDQGFKPSSGQVEELNFRSNVNVWGYFSVAASGGLHEYADSQFGHCFSWGETREDARENLVVALKELSIRGDFLTTVEYLIKLLETKNFQANELDTGWLDTLIADKVQAEKPDLLLSVLTAALHIAVKKLSTKHDLYKSSLARGQLLPASSLTNRADVDFIHEGIKYEVMVTKCSPDSYHLVLNESAVEVETHKLSDGGLLISYDGSSYTTYMKEEVGSYRVVIGNRNCVFETESDPSVLRTQTAGKLINYTVDDGSHITAGSVYAEIEVMKMVMELKVAETGILRYVKRAGAVLAAGSLIARLVLDDSSKAHKAKKFDGTFPEPATPSLKGEKLHQRFLNNKQVLQNFLRGYELPQPYYERKLDEAISTLTKCLKDPNLPLLELQEMLALVSGRLPPDVEKSIRKLVAQYASNITSILSKFPSQQIANIIDGHAATLTSRADKDVFFMTTQSITDLIKRYRNGVRGYMKYIVRELLAQYLEVEERFQNGHFDKCVEAIRRDFTDTADVVPYIFSHAHIQTKNLLVLKIINQFCAGENQIDSDMQSILDRLATLSQIENGKIALRARQVLIATYQPPYDRRYNQVESIFLAAIDTYGQELSLDNLENLITSETSMFDVLPEFFYHHNEIVRMAALEVYIRRGYIAYDLNCLQHVQLPNNLCLIEFQFLLPSSHPNRAKNLLYKRPLLRHRRPSQPRISSQHDHDNVYAATEMPACQRMGVMASFRNFEEFTSNFEMMLGRFIFPSAYDFTDMAGSPKQNLHDQEEPIHILMIAIKADTTPRTDDELSEKFYNFCQSMSGEMKGKGIRRITFAVLYKKQWPKYFTYRHRDGYVEDRIYRHLEPALAFQLEINRMRKFDLEAIPIDNHRMHIYLGKAKSTSRTQEATDYRFFVRAIIRHSDLITKEASYEYIKNEAERTLLEAMDAMEVGFSHPMSSRTDCNHIFLNFTSTLTIADPTNPNKLMDSVREMVVRYGARLWKSRILQAELKMNIKLHTSGEKIPIRVFLSNENGYYLDISMYKEDTDPSTGHVKFRAFGSKTGPLNGLLISSPYVTKDHLQQKRSVAQNHCNTTYVYDFPDVFRQALLSIWQAKEQGEGSRPVEIVECAEMVLDKEQNRLCEMVRVPGENKIGMVAWRMTLRTPEYPSGRDVVVIANDITFKIGSFGTDEDMLFQKASEFAREHGIPRIYIAANSGARIGLAEEIKPLFRVAWNDKADPDKGFKYLYLTPENFTKVSASVKAQLIEDDGESRYKITDIIGASEGLGVENLRGSGMIAGESSQAYNEIPTISYVTCRTIGIGAYLVRLGQRTIQHEQSHIILTGAGALNKLLGREVYTSNAQLGGPQIMYNNGVSHQSVSNDLHGVAAILRWLSYIPKTTASPLPITVPTDPVDRDITFQPSKTPYDPIHMLGGRETDSGWQSGFFDKGSFEEVMNAWAQVVRCGRARLGGIPLGVISVETRSKELIIPADPANLDSDSKLVQQAGQVWFPDSSYKTAQAIQDFNREGLPLMIFANWRGFSGGMKDMYDQILKFGAYIVDGLREYKQPVIVYIPPHAELRGGAWVVVDPTINSRHMELYADPLSRGGVLEPAGTVEIKFRRRELVKAMKRLDTKYQDICEKLNSSGLTHAEKTELEKELSQREEVLAPIYHQIAISFADLHDTPGRMQEKGCINDIVAWKGARSYFYWRLRRLLLEEQAIKLTEAANPLLTDGHIQSMISRWFVECKGTVQAYLWEDNKAVVEWLLEELQEDNSKSVVRQNINCVKQDYQSQQIKQLLDGNPRLAMESLVHLTHILSSNDRKELRKLLSNIDQSEDSSDS
ncbi:acetyl-CoA carboxylase-like [Watersipora subatra]|uniref:acetyl-CoA carboxylase-like n=1 Tax=Watersipora subatra TaxID=2589382 RepID=UPI00355B5BCF